MRRALTITASAAVIVAALGAPAAAFAQPAPADDQEAAVAPIPTGPTEDAPLVDTAQRGVLVFTPDFFADQRPNTALDMVERVPGFQLNDGAGGRGFEGAVGNSLINGARPASKNDTGSNALSRVQAAQVERIELIRGGAPGIDMQGFPVVVNVILKNQSSREHILQADAYLFEGGTDVYGFRYQFTAREGERTWGVVVADGIGTSDSNGPGVVTRRNAAGEVIRTEDFVNDQYGGGQAIRGNYAGPLMGGKIDLTGRLGVSDFQGWDLFTGADSRRESTFGEESKDVEFGATYTRPLTDRLSLETRLIHEGSEFDSLSTYDAVFGGAAEPLEAFTSVGEASESILRGLLRWERSENLTFEGGAEVAYNMLEIDQAYTIGGTPIELPSDQVLVEETRGEVFGKSTWRYSPTLSLEGGLRLEASTISQSGDADQEETFYFAKPRFQATWTPWADNQFRLRLEREVGQLDFGDFAASASLSEDNVLGGNVDLEPEDRWVAEVAYERRFWGDGIVSIAYRHDEIRNAIDVIPLEDGLSAVGNIGDGTLDQLSLNVVIPTDRFGISGGRLSFKNDWKHTEVTDPTTGEIRAISGLRPSQPSITWAQDIPSWKINYRLTMLTMLKQYTYSPDQIFGFEGTDYYEAAIEYKPTETLTLSAQINIWDDFRIYHTVFDARTNPRPIRFVEERIIDPRTFVSLQLRKTF
ncbi:TonB-dependent receptor plug domain-containing protein [Brevundimonas lutea]|uniref:TonB-dependent receptor plug domain-containing protein n=1 Tax=Brevundimonas lutea TaxID=2293980 RepID=UPI000F043B08|nr:TonB-dependent receptor [Brevundimonas lutea]